MKCTATNKLGRPCGAFAVKDLEPHRCVFHTEHAILAHRVFTPEWDLRRKIKLLNRQLASLCRIKDVAVRARLTLDVLARIDALEEKLKGLGQPQPLTYAQKVAAAENEK